MNIVKPNNDDFMSCFTRIYDGYFCIFCAIFTLVRCWMELDEAIKPFFMLPTSLGSRIG